MSASATQDGHNKSTVTRYVQNVYHGQEHKLVSVLVIGELRSKVKVKVTGLPNFQNCSFLGLSPSFWREAQNSWLVMIV